MVLYFFTPKYIVFNGNEAYEFNIVKDLNIPKQYHDEQPVYIHTKSTCDFSPYIIFKADKNWIKKHLPDYNASNQQYSLSYLKKKNKALNNVTLLNTPDQHMLYCADFTLDHKKTGSKIKLRAHYSKDINIVILRVIGEYNNKGRIRYKIHDYNKGDIDIFSLILRKLL